MRRSFKKPGFPSLALTGALLTALVLSWGGCSQPTQDQATQEPSSDGKGRSERAEEAFRESEALQKALATSPAAIDLTVPLEELAALEAKVDEALAAYEELSQGTKLEFAAEKAKLDAVKTKIGHVYTAHAFQGNHAAALELAHTPEELDTPEEAAGLLPKLQAALGAVKALPKPVQELLQDDIVLLESLTAKAEAFSYTIAYNNLNGGANDNPTAYTVNDDDIILKNPTHDIFHFHGWYADAGFNGSPITKIAAGSVGAKTFYARWDPPAPLTIDLQQPDLSLADKTVSVSEGAYFKVGEGYGAYTWRWNGEVIPGATGASYTLAAYTQAAGIYELSVVATGSGGKQLSARSRVTITAEQGGGA